ncbi:hypothetical protein B7494_g560 [Chlorociboria aeruginascens]|nr:hypothetical protein B7494_g560 [Chlorociboria aeruginascens]
MSGVRNLRAMFENKEQSTSPPDRGRSPSGSIAPGSSGTSPRPLSKVRTNFVTVERSGQLGMGLRRDNSSDPSPMGRRTSFSADGAANEKTELSVGTDLDTKKKTTEQAMPEFAIKTPATEEEKQLAEDSKKAEEATPAGKVEVKKASPMESQNPTISTKSSTISNGHTSGPVKPIEKPPPSRTTSKPAPISTLKTGNSSKSLKSPAIPKTPTTPIKSLAKDSLTKSPAKKGERDSSKAPVAKSSRPSVASTSGPTLKTRIPPSPPQTGFVKPKPRSPTKPITLPASLTAHTASSGSKTSSGGQPPTSRPSTSRASQHGVTRSLSRASNTAPKPTASKSRPSLGPPPTTVRKQPSRQSLPSTAHADEGFLARMMRPTASSASKTADGNPITPPKKTQLTNRPHEPPKEKKPVIKQVAKPAGKLATKVTAGVKSVTKETKAKVTPSNAAKQEPNAEASDSEAKEPAPVQEEPASKAEDIPEVTAVQPMMNPTQEGRIDEPTEAAEVHDPFVDRPEDSKSIETPSAEKEHSDETITSTEEIPEEVKTADEPIAPKEESPEVVKNVEEPVSSPEEPKEPAATEVLEATELANTEELQPTALAITEEASIPATEIQPITIPTPETAPEPIKESPIISEPSHSEQISAKVSPVSPISPAKEAVEDPEDLKAKEEIARLNAEMLKAAALEREMDVE